MNRASLVIVAMCAGLLGCGEVEEPRPAVQTAQLRPSEACVDNQCPEGLTCVKYGLGTSEEARCVAPGAICSLLECTEGVCMFFASLPPIAFCATIQP
jgi:hypothetical protein